MSYSESLQPIRKARLDRDEAKDKLYALQLKYMALKKQQKKAVEKDITQDEETVQLIAALREDIAALQQALVTLNWQIAQDPQNQQLEEERQALEQKLNDTRSQLQEVVKKHTTFPADNSQALDAAKKAIEKQTVILKAREKALAATLGSFFQQYTPQQLIEQWNDQIPILLLPLRLETKFKLDTDVKELWVRVFPDDIAVVTHEKVLTPSEITYGIAHWKALWEAQGVAENKKTAWKLLTDKCGLNRAAWVALQTRPLNWDSDVPPASANDLEFPSLDLTKPDNWTEAPHTRVMPDRFVIIGYRGGTQQYLSIGKQVDDVLILGPAPVKDGDNPSITRNDGDNRVNFGDDLQWLTDFNLAVDAGMGFRIPLDSESLAKGFDQLLVVGLKLTADEHDGQTLFQDLLDNHRFSVEGLSLIQQGTPTNNTDDEDAGYSKTQTLDDIIALVETDQKLFTPVSDLREASDGQRLADYLGIDYRVFQSVQNSQLRDHAEAVAMNQALYAGTLGYYMQSMLNGVADRDALPMLRSHFTSLVTGRGPLAALRVGKQPYGILLTSAFDQWKYFKTPVAGASPAIKFYEKLYQCLRYFGAQWKAAVPDLAHISKKGNAGDNLMKVLGLHPNSVELFQRVGYSTDYLKNLEDFSWGGKYAWDMLLQLVEKMYARQILTSFGYSQTNENGSIKPAPLLLMLIYQHYHTRLDNKNFIDGLPLSEEKLIAPYDEAASLHYIHWLIANAGNITTLEKQDFGDAEKPSALLFLMLWNATLLESRHSIHKYLSRVNITAEELTRSRKFMNISSAPSVTDWEVFKAPVNRLVNNETSTEPLYAYIHSRLDVAADAALVNNLAAHKWGMNILKDMPTARLERAFIEHIDTLAYRLDAWQTSLFEQRIQELRRLQQGPEGRKTGIYLGSYGYLENIKPGNKRTRISETILPESLRENKDNLYVESKNGGYVHAPSLNHATAAAILRNGYLTHAEPEMKDMLAVNLSSERVRRAKYLVDGIRNGQTLEALLGYQFERGLHDWTTRPGNPVILNHLIPIFRAAFPITKTKVPQEGKTTGPEEVAKQFHVVNGLALSRVSADFPYGLSFPNLDANQISAIRSEKTEIENTLDALRDLLTSESAYQLALGNFDRAAAVMQAISNSTIPPDIEVINSARGTDLAFTNKVVLHFDSTLATNPWPLVPLTQKALTEPGLNHWIGTLLGDPASIRCVAAAVDKDGNVLQLPDNTPITAVISLQDLQLQPLDFMYLIRNKLEASGTSELETRIRYRFAQDKALADSVIVKIAFTDTGNSADLTLRSFAEILPLANYLRDLVSGSRPLTARDYEPASKVLVAAPNNPENLLIPELLTRVTQVFSYFDTRISQLDTALTNATTLGTEAAVNALRDQLKVLADAGYVFAFPQSATGFGPTELETLVTQGNSVLQRFNALKTKYTAQLAKVNDVNTQPAQQATLLTTMTKSLLGDDYLVMPRFDYNNTTEVAQAAAVSDQLLQYAAAEWKTPLVVREWLHGVSLVRNKMHTLEMVRLLQDTFNDTSLDAKPIQLPYRDNDTWLAVVFPEGTKIDHDTIALLQYTPQGFEVSRPQCGLLIDDWVEALPNKEEVTGISFNFNQPNSVPPQALLLAVTPEVTGHWKWDHLLNTILDTFARAKARAIEPDIVDQMPGISTLLPATMAEFSTFNTNISLDYASNIAYVREQVAALKNLNL
jgi:hypothetical protein